MRCFPPERSQSIDIFRQVLEGVYVLHDHLIVHRDLKPANIGIMPNKDRIAAVIFDFGHTIKMSGRKLQPRRYMVGTRAYLAPEMEERDYDCQVDTWALGVIGVQLTLTGGENPWADIQDITHSGRETSSKRLLALRLPHWSANTMTQPKLLCTEEQDERVSLALLQTSTHAAQMPEYDLMGRLLRCDPEERLTAREARSHPCLLIATPFNTSTIQIAPPRDIPGCKRAADTAITDYGNVKRVMAAIPIAPVKVLEQDTIAAKSPDLATKSPLPWKYSQFPSSCSSGDLIVGPQPESSGVLAHPEL